MVDIGKAANKLNICVAFDSLTILNIQNLTAKSEHFFITTLLLHLYI